MADLYENPMGTDGFEFVEYAAPDPKALGALFESMGFTAIAHHRHKDVTLYRQGDINFIINAEQDSFAQRFARHHGPSVCAIGIRVQDSAFAYKRALEQGAWGFDNKTGPMELNIPAIKGVGDSLLYFVDRWRGKGADKEGAPAPGANIPQRTLRNIALNPNFGGQAMVVSLGCEKLQPARLMPENAIPVANGAYVVTLQDDKHVGFESMITSIMDMAQVRLASLNLRTRETCPAADLVVGVQCGGSDAFSGVTANPAVGFATDLLVRAGATVMFSETTEVRDGTSSTSISA